MSQICVCYSNICYMEVKHLEANYWLFNILYWLLEFLSINRLFVVSVQH